MRAVFPGMEEFSFIKTDFEVMCSCPSGDVFQTEMYVATWVLEDEGKERNSWVSSA